MSNDREFEGDDAREPNTGFEREPNTGAAAEAIPREPNTGIEREPNTGISNDPADD